jgi:hypothetical protein
MSLIRGVLLAGRFQTQHDLNKMSNEDQRNTLIVEMAAHSNQSIAHYQSLNDDTLAGVGAVMVFLRESRIRDDAALKTMSADDQRNTLIVEIDIQTKMGSQLQGFSNMELVRIGLGKDVQGGVSLVFGRVSFIRGVLLAGRFRTQHDLNKMSNEDQRNTLIVEMAAHSNQSIAHYQSLNDDTLAGVGAVMVFLRESRIRDDAALKTMSADDQRNTLIVEIDIQTHLKSRLQALRNMDLVLTGLGVDPVFPPPRRYSFSANSFEIRKQRADSDHSDSDWLSIIVSIANPVTKNIQTLPPILHHIGGSIKTGNIISGPFETASFTAAESDIVIINYVLTNLGSSKAEEQFVEARQVTEHVVGIVGPIVGAAVGFLFFGSLGEGFKVGLEVAKGFKAAIDVLSDVFDFLDIHIAPPNCNGVVLQDTLTFQPGELERAVDQSASREYTGPEGNERCGGAPQTKMNFSVHHQPRDGLILPRP